jgi:hypothetical protein
MLMRDHIDDAEPNDILRWSYENASPGVGVDTQGLEPQSQNTEIQGCEIVSVAACPQRRAETTEGTVRSNDAIQGPDPSFVCFQASWPVDCCTRSRQ